MTENDVRKALENLKVFHMVKASKPDYEGALDLFTKIMTASMKDSDISYGKLAAIYQGITKQIPEEPVISQEIMTMFHCPVCGCSVDSILKDSYCSYCGQAIDWGKDE